mgnify:CR=1 FL=1|jgi:hypothetical protein
MPVKRKLYKYTVNRVKEGKKVEIIGTGIEYPAENILRIKKDGETVAEFMTDDVSDLYCVAMEDEEEEIEVPSEKDLRGN